ncbi:hypothetical protein [Acinetobacter albensis]|uniref:Uncharacterized protein n=1 Tax=Acinetobacter albensis TaxID=1673609 RepID=A0A1C4GU80_9GAMM|nr:hypothetical protein [Acinetobacter albensis]SCC71403.1 hypothetical protein GA0116959_10433 [Acinetobacter albensis]
MTSDQRNSPKLLMGIIGGMVAIIVLFFAYQWFMNSSSEVTTESESINSTVSTPVKPSEPVRTLDEKTIQLVDESILKTATPNDPALAKEEVAKLEDIQTQLHDQENILKAQHNDADQLITLKEEQIKLIEAQLVQK